MNNANFNKKELQPNILVVEDEESIAIMIQYNLEKEGYRVRVTSDGEEAMLMIEESKPDLILLDWMLPSMSGIEICRHLRSKDEYKTIPIIMISAKGEGEDKIRGLDCGVDDYLVKPFLPTELSARIRAVFRRIRPAFTKKHLEFEDVKLDLISCNVTRDENPVHLGPTEFKILQSLMEYPSRVLTRDQLIRKVWGYDNDVEYRTIDVHINRLRKALNLKGEKPNIIKTIRSTGYSLTNSNNI
ncbi:MAG: phosphate regulon transcriptional regulator PhoB [Pseudomonadota bacterium]